MPQALTEKLLKWYADHGRDLPWRRSDDPYAIWVAEVMLQQTRVETVKPYYRRWMDRFPNVTDLAEASKDEVLNEWEGLGYYRRALNLHRAAEIVQADHGGQLPSNESELRRLPGIGPYTAAAVGSIAFGADILALDGNLRRVLARLFDIEDEVRSSQAEQRMRREGGRLLPSGRAGEFNQALMDLGAMICLPRAPKCEACPLEAHCLARQQGAERERPVRRKQGPLPHVTRVAAVLTAQTDVLIGRRPEGELLGGLWEFPGGELQDGEAPRSGLARALTPELDLEQLEFSRLGSYEHSYTHYRVTAHAFTSRLSARDRVLRARGELEWVSVSELEQYPMGKIDRSIARDLQDALAD